jgi:Concanavalin A-like lectin/glucanases superfamily/K319L-like, PKD domain
MDGFELYGNGLYWWNTGYQGDEVIPAQLGQVGIKTLLAGRFLVVRNTATAIPLQTTRLRANYQSIGRTDNYLFFFGDYGNGTRIYKRPIFGVAVDDAGNDYTGVGCNEGGSILVSGSLVYWNVRGGAAANNGEIRVKSVDAGPGGGDTIIGSGVGLVKKMRVVPLYDSDGNFFRNYLYMLNTAGEIWRIRLPSIFQPGYSSPSRLAFDVTDFDTRQETDQQSVPPFGIRIVSSTRLYAATGATLNDSRLPGRVVIFNLTDGTSSELYNSGDVNLQVTGVVLDSDRIFITRTPLRFDGVMGGFGGWVYDTPNSQILHQVNPAHHGILFGFPFESIALFQEGGNLRSDGQWLYYTHQSQIRKIKTDSPPLTLDYRAVGLEAVQAVQDYNNSVTLVAGKPTLVRGYAQLVLPNTTGIASFPLAGRLRAFRNGQQLPGEAWSQNTPFVDGAADLATLRTNLDRSFLFDVPQEWFDADGPLQFQFTVNPNGTVPETGATPLANNSATITATVNHKGTPCLIFAVMSSTFPNYDPSAPNSLFGDILDRALTQLPVPGFKYAIRSGSFTKPVVTLTGIKERSFSIPDDTSWALTLLSALQWLSKDPPGCPDTHWAGMFPTQDNFNGQGEAPGNTLVFRMGMENAGNWNGPRGGFALAHELSHNYGRNHISTPTNCNTGNSPAGPFDSYNGSPCTLGGTTDLNDPATPIGYDYRTGTLILPTMAGDLMSYADIRWISPQTWARDLGSISSVAPAAPALAAPFISPAGGQPPGPVLFVQGFLNTAVPAGLLLPVIQGQPGDFDLAKINASLAATAALPPDSPHRLRLLDAANNVLLDVAAVTNPFTDQPPEKLKFAQFLPLDPAVVRVQLVSSGRVLAEFAASANPPSLVLDAPILNVVNETLALSWTAADADHDPLFFTVQFSPDDGATWQTIRVHDPSPGITLSTKLLAGGNACRLRVIASDGFNTTIAITDPFAIAAHRPFITIAGLLDGQRLPYGTSISPHAFAYDAEDGSLNDTGIHWTLTGPETRSHDGGVFSLHNLAPGAHTLAISATDTDGNTGTRTLQFEVLPPSVPDTAAPVLDGLCVDAAYASAPGLRLYPDLPEPSARFVHANGALYVCFNGLPRSDDGTDPSLINFYVNADGAPTSTPQPDDYGFGVDENGIPYEARGDGNGLVALLPQDFSVQIMQGIGTWSAEFRIPDTLIGGWSHDASLTVLFLRNYCLSVPFVGCISLPDPPAYWPEQANVYQPASWASVTFGPPAALANTAPVAIASGPAVLSFSEPQTVTLNGAGSYDLEGDALTFSWTQTDGPAVSLADATSATPSFGTPNLNAPATVTFQLTVNDGQVDSAPALVTVSLTPVAASTAGGSVVKTPVTINGDGSANIQLCWPGTAGDTVVIQASSDLVAWDNIATNAVSYLGVVLHLDLEASAYPYRFYRAVSWQPNHTPVAGGALEFDGVDDRVQVPDATALNAFPLTVAAWIKTTQTSPGYVSVVNKYFAGSGNGYSLHINNGRLYGFYFRGNGTSYVYAGDPGLDGGFIADGLWHHVAYEIDATGGRIYVDGVQTASLGWTGTPGGCTTTTPVQFGYYPIGGQVLSFAGDMDEVTLWHRTFTDLEIQAMMNHPLTGTEAGLIGCWSFDEADGDVATDITGFGHDGALLNGTLRLPSDAPIYP